MIHTWWIYAEGSKSSQNLFLEKKLFFLSNVWLLELKVDKLSVGLIVKITLVLCEL